MRFTTKTHGFTLIELLITVTIIAILSSIVYPSYQSSVLKSRRTDAKSVLLQAANWMEQFYTMNNRYDQTLVGSVSVTDSTSTAAFPKSGLIQSPINGATKYYDITLATVTSTAFTLNATPNSATNQTKDPCKTLTLDQIGAKGITGTGITADDCWR
ncbi:type IV pilus assembly protein PilE [Gammaproteobacteria bacterium]